jgi:hypothetical protein
MKSSIFWDITPCSPLKVNIHFGGTCRPHLQGWSISQARNRRESMWHTEAIVRNPNRIQCSSRGDSSSVLSTKNFSSACHLISGWFLALLILEPWRWRRHIYPKRQLPFNELHVISQKIELFMLRNVTQGYVLMCRRVFSIVDKCTAIPANRPWRPI